ncbi:AI-2E family transporter [Nonomuraea glycinis]|uniref:AI-2E family transporter n=1 Tax=Nonomuraea glycinis TaxID=2047744 RepID=UPI0033AD792E
MAASSDEHPPGTASGEERPPALSGKPAPASVEEGASSTVQVVLSPSNVWRVGFAVAAMVALVFFLHFVLTDAGSFLFVVVMAWFLSLAMEPPVARLARHMRRGAATALVMAGMGVAAAIFLVLFGQLFLQQVALLVESLPDVLSAVTRWINGRLGTRYEISNILESIRLTPQDAAGYAQDVLGGLLGLVGTVAGVVFNVFALVLLTYYLSADGPRARRWIAGLLTGRFQQVFVSIWELSTEKTGGYVAARLILAAINGSTSALAFLVLGMPSWLALGLWTGVVAQFVPTIGTYISIALPVVVGLASPTPWIGVAALIWAVVYQQVENLTLEPRISARSVDIHPGVSFAAAIMGAMLFGAVGALLAIPVVAMLLSVLDTFGTRHAIQPALTPPEEKPEEKPEEEPGEEPAENLVEKPQEGPGGAPADTQQQTPRL